MNMARVVCTLLALSAVVASSPTDDLFERVLGPHAGRFVGNVTPAEVDSFTIVAERDSSGRQVILGNTVGSVASGLQYYLTNYAKVQIRTWSGSNTQLPATLPTLSSDVTKKRTYQWGYYLNVCTLGYTMAWWQWDRWEQELDWMALNGINLPLAFVGQEYVWQKMFAKFGLTSSDLASFFSGPAFLPWQRMGNMQGWGGPLPQEFINDSMTLQMKILQRMQELGITPVLPAFAGHLPSAFTTKYPNSTYVKSPDWGHMPVPYGNVWMLEPTDSMYITLGKAFIETYREVYNTTSYHFNADQYNELTPSSSNTTYIASAGKAMYDSLIAAEPKAVWVMQGWLFESGFWTYDRAQAYLSLIPNNHILILDLRSEGAPVYPRLDSYFGKPFVWNMLHDWGGNTGMYGEFDNINTTPQSASVKNTTIAGFGLTMEGTLTNYAVYELMLQNIWRTEPHSNMTEWCHNYSERRYGARLPQTMRVWELLYHSVYNGTVGKQKDVTRNIITYRPMLNMHNVPLGRSTTPQYDPLIVQNAMAEMVSVYDQLSHQETYLNDLVDITRQAISNELIALSDNHTSAITAKNLTEMGNISSKMMSMFADEDTLLGSSKFFLLGTWLNDARSWGHNNTQSDMYEWNARNQITLWGPTGNIDDYAGKEWSGLIRSYYMPRWELFFNATRTAVEAGKVFDQSTFDTNCLALDQTWQHKTHAEQPFPSTPTGDTKALVLGIIKKYFPGVQPKF